MNLTQNFSLKKPQWIIATLITLLGGMLRFWNLGKPQALVFDETYYVKDAYSLLQKGVELQWPDNANENFNNGNLDVFLNTPSFAIHPPLGKWMISLGMLLFSPETATAWRFSAALVGTLSILIIAIIATTIFKNPLLGNLAALLVAVDGHHITHSRTAMLDIFLMFWVLVSFWILIIDQEYHNKQLPLQQRAIPWKTYSLRAALGVTLGLALGTKWSALYYIATFTVLIIFWDTRRNYLNRANPQWLKKSFTKDLPKTLLIIFPTVILSYLATWIGWFSSSEGYYRNWATENSSTYFGWIPAALRSLWSYHQQGYQSMLAMRSDHPAVSPPWAWIFQIKPTPFFRDNFTEISSSCPSGNCVSYITSVGNLLIWWGAAAALVLLAVYYFKTKDWRIEAILLAVAAGYLPWFLYQERPIYAFYSIVFFPYLVLGIVYVVAKILEHPSQQKTKIIALSCYLIVVVALSYYFYPINTGEVIPVEQFNQKLWFQSWR